MTSIDQLSMYERQQRRNTPQRETLPDWVNEGEGFRFPFHSKFQHLAQQYKEAQKQHSEAIAVLQFARLRRLEDPQIPENPESIKECQRKIEEAKEALERTERELWEFVNH